MDTVALDERWARRLARPRIEEHFWAKVDRSGACWMWTGYLRNGYGRFSVTSRDDRWTAPAHRVAYMLLVGGIPDGLVLDHICRTTACVNPDHLRPVTQHVNILVGIGPTAINARKTRCKRGHPFTPENTYVNRRRGLRECRTCRAAARAEARRRKRGQRVDP